MCGFSFPDLNGVGIKRTKNEYFDWKNKDGSPAIEWKKGERTPWGVSFTPANELINIPVILNGSAKVYRTDYTKFHVQGEIGDKHRTSYWEEGADNSKVVAELDHIQFTLGHILYGLIWELTWHGNPKDRDSMSTKLKDMVKDIKEEKK